jgi:hypothetical protein
MENSIVKQAQHKARLDWNNKQPRFLINGRLSTEHPSLGKQLFFYPKYYTCHNNDDVMFIEAYNKAINQLIEENGVPYWSPRSRVPSRQFVLEELNRSGQHISKYKRSSIPEKRGVESLCEKWNDKGKPIMWSRVEDKQLLLIAGDIHEKASRVEVLDLESGKGTWMASFEFLRKHCLQMPWDKFNMLMPN